MIETFIHSLKQPLDSSHVFNPWWQIDLENDIDDTGPAIRRHQLSQYLHERIGKAKFLLVGEALGYQGGHFTGIAMTSERILLGHHSRKGILPEHVFSLIEPRRTSRPDLKPQGFSEPTATIVWGHMAQSHIDPRKFLLWNAFPWHPFKPASGSLSNRTPAPGEFHAGAQILTGLLEMTSVENIIAVGEKSYGLLNQMGINSKKVRHPANGGAKKFRQQISSIML